MQANRRNSTENILADLSFSLSVSLERLYDFSDGSKQAFHVLHP